VGLLAIGPIDAIEISVSIDDITLKQPGVMGSTIIEGQTTMLVDIFEIVDALFPEWFEDREVLKLLSKEKFPPFSLPKIQTFSETRSEII